MEFQIPRHYITSLKEFVALPPAQRTALIAELKTQDPVFKVSELARKIAEKLSTLEGLDEGKIHRLLNLIAGFYSARIESGISADEFAGDFVSQCKSEIKLGQEEWDRFRADVLEVLQIDGSFAITTKAQSLMFRHQHVFTTASIVSDIRPVFKNSEIEEPDTAMLIHTLRIAYVASAEPKELYFALDSADLTILDQAIQRAKQKDASLRKASGKLRLKIFES